MVLPGGRRLGAGDADVTLTVHELAPLAHLAAGQVPACWLATAYEGSLCRSTRQHARRRMAAAAQMIPTDPTAGGASSWWRQLLQRAKSVGHHSAERPTRGRCSSTTTCRTTSMRCGWTRGALYSCAYYRDAGMTLAQAQEAKLDHVCRKLMLREGERFLDIGAGWGGLAAVGGRALRRARPPASRCRRTSTRT